MTLDFNDKETQNDIIATLRESTVCVTFTKADGTERVMRCTLNATAIPEDKLPKTESSATVTDAIRVFDVEADGWRSFRWDRVKDVQQD